MMDVMTFTIAAFYCFVALPDPAALRSELRESFTEEELCGTILIAPEGVNGTVAGSAEVTERLLHMLTEKVLPRSA